MAAAWSTGVTEAGRLEGHATWMHCPGLQARGGRVVWAGSELLGGKAQRMRVSGARSQSWHSGVSCIGSQLFFPDLGQ